uniref:C3H1-type domain-containing protein n=1 Tax=Bigelowiella natans TaxID=227086 RepID=A0A6T9YPE5_BIGNA|mmetsp:Transcript_843/g.1293  ORF Transcript_843/g.1293 Transcript_843/m.1293 type:complete len:196 (+) Transcript_843:828-1415(+)
MKTGQCKFGVTCKFNHPPNMGGTQKMAMDRCIPCTTFNEKGYPSRPGQPQCQFYMKTGECKFGATCRFDHPFHVQVTPHLNMRPADRVNSKGLPLRPGVQPCSFYMKTGDCKFGITCKFDHPEMSQERFSELKAAQFNQVGATQGQVVNTGSVMQVSESNNVDTKAEPAAVDSLQPQEKAEDEPKQSEAVESKEE